ncbi:MAG: hypothetical protein HYS76_00305 [Candidatus Wildermuthbacteria bacterium]|nr:hypothetical protein [Candidatus Wildermuthbacteria bacterium]
MRHFSFAYVPVLLFIGGVLVFANPAYAADSVPEYTLTVQKGGTGTGSVVDGDYGKISCGSTCSFTYSASLGSILLEATPGPDSTFSGWIGPCMAITGDQCAVKIDAAKTVTANFTLDSAKILFPLSVNLDGIGSVTSNPIGIRCGSIQPEGPVCIKEFSISKTILLTATQNPGSSAVFSDWSGGCTRVDGNTCSVFMDAAKVVTAKFIYPPLQTAYPLSVTVVGGGNVVSEDKEIFCDQKNSSLKCTKAYIYGRDLLLTANSPSSLWSFESWTGNCRTVTGDQCLMQIDGPKTIMATFREIPQKKTLTVVSYGPGSVKSATGGIICPSDCAKEYDKGSAVTLTPVPQAGATFLGWKGACKGQEPCAVSLERARFVYARFRLVNATLSAAKKGFGTVTSIPAGLVCGNVCSVPYPTDTVVTLYATPLKGQTFARWEGADECKGTEPRCTVQMGIDRSVTAVFLPSSSF